MYTNIQLSDYVWNQKKNSMKFEVVGFCCCSDLLCTVEWINSFATIFCSNSEYIIFHIVLDINGINGVGYE